MKETRVETIQKITKRERENPFSDNNTIQIEAQITVTRLTSLPELQAIKGSLERDLEDTKKLTLEIEGRLRDMNAQIARISAEVP